MPDIVLTTLNARHIHAAFGLRYLLANLGMLQSRACLVEFDINQRPLDVAEVLLAREPKIIGFGVYIWNVSATTEVVGAIKRIRPDITIILGGPEVSYETEDQTVVQLADYVITGEADLKFAEVCQVLLGGRKLVSKVVEAAVPDVSQLVLPYELYDDQDLEHRILYVEASRGCPFTCEFCLSSLDIPVRQIPLVSLLEHFQQLLDRGAKQFKFVDRTFNLNISSSRAILEFFLERYKPGHFFHFEMIPDRLPGPLREVIARFPPGALQFEVGIQTFNEEVSGLIKRRQNYDQLRENMRFLRSATGVHVHADLIAGLPGESLESFGSGFDQLVELAPQEIQVGILKRLRGTPIVRHDADWQMAYNPNPPYEILRNKLIDFGTMQRLRRFARYWDLIGNSGNFIQTAPLIWKGQPSAFRAFMKWSDWLFAQIGRTDSISLVRLMEYLFVFLTRQSGHNDGDIARAMWRDYQSAGRADVPNFLRGLLSETSRSIARPQRRLGIPKRQRRRQNVNLASADATSMQPGPHLCPPAR